MCHVPAQDHHTVCFASASIVCRVSAQDHPTIRASTQDHYSSCLYHHRLKIITRAVCLYHHGAVMLVPLVILY
jgi:hypothetical protein